MSVSATLNHAAQVLASLGADQRADTALRLHFEAHRYLQPVARRAITQGVFAYFRGHGWLDPKASPQKRLAHAATLHARFAADPKSVKPEALAARAVPGWLADEMDQIPVEWLRQLQRDPALWLRARPGTGAALAKSLFACEPASAAVHSSLFRVRTSAEATVNHEPTTVNLSDALRFTGTQDLFKTEQFKTGEFEIQDLASQLVGFACAPRPGENWWDACAGEGGKTLHLADLMANQGVVWATDRSARRLDTLRRRFARAKLFNYRTGLWAGGPKLPTKQNFDGILVDAPCSGVGTWQRNPHARWTVTPDDVGELAATQRSLLDHVAGSLKPGGRLVYAVCTLTRRETTAVAADFTAAHPELEPSPVFAATAATPALATAVTFWPHELNANGMFIAAWRRKT